MAEMGYHPLYLRGIDQFNGRQYFESHETWEELWGGEHGPARQFYKGLIQAAVALHHAAGGNARGAASLLRRARGHLGRYRGRYLGLEVDEFLTAVSSCVDEALSARVGGGRREVIPLMTPEILLAPAPCPEPQ